MSIVSRLRRTFRSWRETDPYHYECAVCERTFQAERDTCPDCGGAVERIATATEPFVGDVRP